MKKLLITFLVLAVNLNIEAQTIKKALSLLDFPYDSTYIEDFGSALLLKPIVAYRSFSYQFYNSVSDELSSFKPQASIYAGLGGAYKNLQAQLTFPIAAINSGNPKQDEFTALDISLGLKTNSLNGAFTYKQFRGLTMEEQSGEAIVLPDAELLKLGLKGFYSFNSSYSVNSVYKQTQRQKQQTGSFFLGADAFYLENNYDETLETLYNISLITGYGYNFIPHRKWYISPLIFGGIGLQHPENLASDLSEKNVSLLYDLRLSTGYNSEHIIVGCIFQYEKNTLYAESYQYGMSALYLKFNMAYRFIFD